MLSEMHFRSLRTKMLLQCWTDETARQLEVVIQKDLQDNVFHATLDFNYVQYISNA